MQCNSYRQKKKHKKPKNKEQWSQREKKTMKHKDHVKKTQLVWVFYIQNFLDAPRALEFLFSLEWFPTPRLE